MNCFSFRLLWIGLLVAGFAGTGRAGEEKSPPKTPWKETGELTAKDEKDKVLRRSPHKVHHVKLKAGKIYRIDLTSDDFDAFLRLESPTGDRLTMDDDGGGGLNARIIAKPAKSGEYRLIVASLNGKVGSYTVSVKDGTPAELSSYRIAHLAETPKEERKEVLADFSKSLAAKGAKIDIADARRAMQIAHALEADDKTMAASAYTSFGKLLAASSNEKLADLAKTFEGAGRRLTLQGHAMKVRGTTAAGAPLDLAKLKGKVVLVDFWATWCGPCLGEIPNIKKMYKKYHDDGFEVIGVSVDRDKEALTKFLEKNDLPWQSIHDRKTEEGESLSTYYGIFAIPLAILVDREGNVVSMNARGPELERLLAKLIPTNE